MLSSFKVKSIMCNPFNGVYIADKSVFTHGIEITNNP